MRVAAALCAAVAATAPWMPTRRLRLPTGTAVRTVIGVAFGILVAAIVADAGAPAAVAVAAGVLVVPAPGAFLRSRERRASSRIATRWPDFLAAVRSRVAGGSPIPEAVRAAGRHVGGPFGALDGGFALGFDDFMREARGAWADPTADRVLITLAAANRAGGGRVDEMLGRLADSLAAELRLRRAHDAALTQQRLTSVVALLAPWAILALSLATNPTASAAYATPIGTGIVMGGLAATALGHLIATRTARLSRSPRLFG
jgi:Flp pilus assembly protein TadB